jgi:hypothetical protein
MAANKPPPAPSDPLVLSEYFDDGSARNLRCYLSPKQGGRLHEDAAWMGLVPKRDYMAVRLAIMLQELQA